MAYHPNDFYKDIILGELPGSKIQQIKGQENVNDKTEEANTMLYVCIKGMVKNQYQKQLRIPANYFMTFLSGETSLLL